MIFFKTGRMQRIAVTLRHVGYAQYWKFLDPTLNT
jgi:hypothetical protein